MADVIHRVTREYKRSVHTPDFSTVDWIINPDLSNVSNVPEKYWKISGDDVVEMSLGEKEDVDNADLITYKATKFSDIDRRTDELISQGFVFNQMQFSLSGPAQARMMGINQIRDDSAVIYPIRWNNIDDTDYYDIPNAETFRNFYLAGVGAYRSFVDSGTELKNSVRAATTPAEVDAVIDSR